VRICGRKSQDFTERVSAEILVTKQRQKGRICGISVNIFILLETVNMQNVQEVPGAESSLDDNSVAQFICLDIRET
jgi:hypothetical protein